MQSNQTTTGALMAASGEAMTLRAAVRRRASRERSGSFLVLVVGTLALIAVITIVYVALGSQDSRTRSAVEARRKLDVVAPQIADHIAGIVGRDAVATRVDIVTADPNLTTAIGGQRLVRETIDAPSVRWDVRVFSNVPGESFNPEGSASGLNTSVDVAPIASSDPWLAAPAAIALDPASVAGTQARPDWPAISNVAPDGAFVSLFNLRNNFAADAVTMRSALTPANDLGVTDADRPATFTLRQAGTHLPAAIGPTTDWSDAAMKLYEWADADGDGWLDSRWYELVKQTGVGQFAKQLDVPDGKYRYVFATRIIDLSGRVNVNTATDLTLGPSGEWPLGTTPADVDLRRLLTLADATLESGIAPASVLLAGEGGSLLGLYDATITEFVGHQAYRGLRFSSRLGTALGRDVSDGAGGFLEIADDAALTSTAFAQLESSFGIVPSPPATPEWKPFAPFSTVTPPVPAALEVDAGATARAQTYADGVSEPVVLGVGAVGEIARVRFGVDDLYELLERNGLNSERTSALEQAQAGRARETYGNVPDNFTELDPLLSTRSPAFETRIADLATDPSGDTPLTASQARLAMDVRSKITSISGARQLRPARTIQFLADPATLSMSFADPNTMQAGESKIPVLSALANSSNPDTFALYLGYADALAAFSDLDNAWQVSPGPTFIAPDLRTLFYGHRGPAFALQVAGHMATNLADLIDTDQSPSVTTLELAGGYVATNLNPTSDAANVATGIEPVANLDAIDLLPGYFRAEQDPAGGPDDTLSVNGTIVARQRLSLAADRLAPDPADVPSPVINLYGLEPQAFLTQVGSVAVYWDDDTGTGNDDTGTGEVRISGNIPTSAVPNSEMLFRAVVLHLHNPFDQPVELSQAPLEETVLDTGATGPLPRPVYTPVTGDGTFGPLDAPGKYVSMGEWVTNSFTADRLGEYYYVDVGDTRNPTALERGRRFVLASLREQVSIDPAVQNPAAVEELTGIPGQFFRPLGAAAPAAVTLEGITIPPGETITCIAITSPPSEVFRRLAAKDAALASSVPGPNVPTQSSFRDRIMRAIGRQFGAGSTASTPNEARMHWIPQIDAETGAWVGFDPSGSIASYTEVIPQEPAVAPGPQYVTLWRTIRSGPEAYGDPVASVPGSFTAFEGSGITVTSAASVLLAPNNYENDQLVDRMRVVSGTAPARATLDVRLPASNVSVNNTTTNGSAGRTNVPDNELTLALSLWVRRPGDARPALQRPEGVLPAYCIEPKYLAPDAHWNATYRTQKTQDVQVAGAGVTLSDNDFTSAVSFNGFAETVTEWRSEMDGTSTTPTSLRGEPFLGVSPAVPTQRANLASPFLTNPVVDQDVTAPEYDALTDDVRFSLLRSGTRPPTIPGGDEDLELADAPVQLFESSLGSVADRRKALRVGDLLLPMGVGAFSAPFDAVGFVRTNSPTVALDQFLARHTTLGEVMAEVFAYSDPAVSLVAPFNASTTDPAVWFNPDLGPGTNLLDNLGFDRTDEILFDQGRLALDRFVPFHDLNGDGVRTLDEGAGLDEVPLALGVLDQFMITPPGSSRNGQPISSITRAQPGLVNLNTAALETLRTLPGLSPLFQNGDYNWSQDLMAFPSGALPGEAEVGRTTDIAATLAAYRDGRAAIRPSTLASSEWSGGYAGPFGSASLDPSIVDLSTHTEDYQFAGLPATLPAARQHLVFNMPERPYFRSVGETLAARVLATGDPNTRGLPVNMDYLGFNATPATAASATPNYSDSTIDSLGQFRSRASDDGVPNGYDERVALLSSISNSVTTRSDTYAAWFVIHGYSQEDVERLQPGDPMIPSIARRYLMVIDRSNVTSLGQKPRVLLMREVPYEFPARR